MNELVTWSFEDKQPIDDVVFEKYGKNPPEFGANLGEYLRGVIASLKPRRPRWSTASRAAIAGADYRALRVDRDQHRRSAAVPAEEVPSGNGIMNTYNRLRERHARRRLGRGGFLHRRDAAPRGERTASLRRPSATAR